MRRVLLLIALGMTLSSCSTLKELQENEGLQKVGSFQLNPVQENTYWYDGKSYEYKDYQIEITSAPIKAHIRWGGKIIGTTPFMYYFSGVLDRDDRVVVNAIPIDETLPAQEAVLRVRTELPRKIHFDLDKK